MTTKKLIIQILAITLLSLNLYAGEEYQQNDGGNSQSEDLISKIINSFVKIKNEENLCYKDNWEIGMRSQLEKNQQIAEMALSGKDFTLCPAAELSKFHRNAKEPVVYMYSNNTCQCKLTYDCYDSATVTIHSGESD